LTATLFLLAAGVGLPVVFFATGDANYELADAATVTGLVLYSAGHMSALLVAGDKRPLQGVFWLFCYVSMGVAPLAQLVTGESQRIMDPGQARWAYFLVLAGLMSYDIGTAIAKRSEARQAASLYIAASPSATLNRARLNVLSIFALSYSLLQIAQRGVAIYFSSRQESLTASVEAIGDQDGQAIRGILSAFGSVPPVVALICWIVIAGKERRESGKSALSSKLWVTAFVAVNLVINSPVVNSRFWFLTVAIAIFFAIPWTSAATYRSVLLWGAAGAVLLFPVSDIFRLSAEYRAQYGFTSRGVVENLAVKDYDQMVMIANGLWYVDERGFHLGYQMLGNLAFWIPRQIWPDKPLDTGVEIGQAMQAINVNLSSPLWIEAFVDAGVIGTVLVFLAAGFASRRADTVFLSITRSGRIGAVSVLLPMLAGYQFILLRGPLLQAMGRLAVMLLLTGFLLSRIGSTAKEAARARPRQFDRV
jgi:hypothetical protein